jgi:hypothetical protein
VSRIPSCPFIASFPKSHEVVDLHVAHFQKEKNGSSHIYLGLKKTMINNLEVIQKDNLKKNQKTFLFTFPSSKYKDLFFHLPLTPLAKSHTIMIEKG